MSVSTNKENQELAGQGAAGIAGDITVATPSSSADTRNNANTTAAIVGSGMAGGMPVIDPGAGSIKGMNPLYNAFGGNKKKREAAIWAANTAAANQYMDDWKNSESAELNPFQETLAQYSWAGRLPGSYTAPGEDSGIMYINPLSGSADPRGTQAALTRAQFDEWVNTFQPAEGDLLSMTTYDGNPGVAAGLIASQRDSINRNFGKAANAQERNWRRFGMNPTVEQQQAAGAGMALNHSLSVVDAVNKTNSWQQDLNKEIMSSGMATNPAIKKSISS